MSDIVAKDEQVKPPAYKCGSDHNYPEGTIDPNDKGEKFDDIWDLFDSWDKD